MSKRHQARANYEKKQKPGGIIGALTLLVRFTIFLIAIASLAVAGFFLYVYLPAEPTSTTITLGPADSRLNPVQKLYLQGYLNRHLEQLAQPVGTGQNLVPFTINPGESARQIAQNLLTAGLLTDSELFLNYLQYTGQDAELEAGAFQIDPRLAIPALADTLTRAYAPEVELRFLEGWRLEELGAYLAATQPANINAQEFLAITQGQTAFDLRPYHLLAELPPQSSLEGFLFPDTYRLPTDATATDLVDTLLSNFENRVTLEMRQAYAAHGLTLPQAVTLASIVEREAVIDPDRPLIASVFYNRLALGMRLEADPTVQYALGYQAEEDNWWKSPLWLDDLSLDSPYNTYVYTGLPPSPIASPGLSSLQAVAFPADSEFIFFVADCTSPVAGAHLFTTTYNDHLTAVERCR